MFGASILRSRPAVVVASATARAILVGGISLAVAAPSSSSHTYYACANDNDKVIPGKLSIDTPPKCSNGQTVVSWSGSGPTGATGATGVPIWVNVRSDGTKVGGSSGTSSTHLRTGIYRVTFGQDVTSCGISIDSAAYLGAGIIGINGNTIDPPDSSHDFFSVFQDLSTANSLVIGERNASGTFEDGPFTIAMTCS